MLYCLHGARGVDDARVAGCVCQVEAEAVPEVSEKLEIAMVPTFVLVKVSQPRSEGVKVTAAVVSFITAV